MKTVRVDKNVYEVFIYFIQLIYEQANIDLPTEFDPNVEALRLSNTLRLQGCGISTITPKKKPARVKSAS